MSVANPPIATIRVGEKGRLNLPAHLRELAMIKQGDLLVVTSVANGEVVIKTPAAIREYIHSGIVTESTSETMADWKREDVRSAEASFTRKLDAQPNPDAGDALLRSLGL